MDYTSGSLDGWYSKGFPSLPCKTVTPPPPLASSTTRYWTPVVLSTWIPYSGKGYFGHEVNTLVNLASFCFVILRFSSFQSR